MPADRSPATAVSRAPGSMSASTTRAPRSPRRRAVARPMPLAPPVITAPLALKSSTLATAWRDALVAGADEERRQHGWLRAAVVPAVARAVLHHRVPGVEHLLGAVVELEHHLAGDDDLEVDRVGGVHPRVVGLHVRPHAGKLPFDLGGGRSRVDVSRRLRAGGWEGEEEEPEATNRGKERRLVGLGAAVGERGHVVVAPEAVELGARNGGHRERG